MVNNFDGYLKTVINKRKKLVSEGIENVHSLRKIFYDTVKDFANDIIDAADFSYNAYLTGGANAFDRFTMDADISYDDGLHFLETEFQVDVNNEREADAQIADALENKVYQLKAAREKSSRQQKFGVRRNRSNY